MDTPLRPADSRRPELDWLRVFAILLLHLFHVGMMFNTWGWHLKSAQTLPVLEPPMQFLHAVRMPLLMLIAGAGTAFALRRRSVRALARDRIERLLVPLVFGMFVIVPPQIFIERVARGTFHGTYLDFYPSVFELVSYPAGSLSWHHLWFVAYLFLYSMLALPLLAWLRTGTGRGFLERADRWLARGWSLWLLALPLALVQLVLRRYPETHALFDDPKTFAWYGLLFLYGHVLARCPAAWDSLVARRRTFLAATAVLLAVMLPPNEYPAPLEILGRNLAVLGVLFTSLAWARAFVTRRRPWLVHAQELAYPFYILHQTVIIVVGFWILRAPFGPWALAGLVLVTSFLATWGLAELAARVAWLRPLLGMKPRRAGTSERPSTVAKPLADGHSA